MVLVCSPLMTVVTVVVSILGVAVQHNDARCCRFHSFSSWISVGMLMYVPHTKPPHLLYCTAPFFMDITFLTDILRRGHRWAFVLPQCSGIEPRQSLIICLASSTHFEGFFSSLFDAVWSLIVCPRWSRQVDTDGSNAQVLARMGRPKSFVFDLGEGYPTFTLYYDCHGHGVS